MPDPIEEILPDATAETLELMAFVAPLPLEGPARMPKDGLIVSLRFTGAATGTIQLASSAAFGGLLADNMLGPDDAPTPACQRGTDALKEALNVLSGTLLRHLCKDCGQVEMSLPECVPATPESWADIADDESALVLDADGFVLVVRARYKESA
jgi:hypothetical protein